MDSSRASSTHWGLCPLPHEVPALPGTPAPPEPPQRGASPDTINKSFGEGQTPSTRQSRDSTCQLCPPGGQEVGWDPTRTPKPETHRELHCPHRRDHQGPAQINPRHPTGSVGQSGIADTMLAPSSAAGTAPAAHPDPWTGTLGPGLSHGQRLLLLGTGTLWQGVAGAATAPRWPQVGAETGTVVSGTVLSLARDSQRPSQQLLGANGF